MSLLAVYITVALHNKITAEAVGHENALENLYGFLVPSLDKTNYSTQSTQTKRLDPCHMACKNL